MIFTIDGRPWAMHPRRDSMTPSGGDVPATQRRTISGELVTITPAYRTPRTLEVRGPADHVVSEADASALVVLFNTGAVFELATNYATPDGSAETWPQCRVLRRPAFRRVAPGLCTYEFAIQEV